MKKKIIVILLIFILILISVVKINIKKIYNIVDNINAENVQGFSIQEFLYKGELHILVVAEDDVYGINQVEYPEKEMILYGNGKNKVAFDVDIADITKTYYFTYTNGNNEKVVKAYKYESKNEFDYTGDIQIFVAKTTGTYKIQLWGSQGGSRYNNGGKGGYSEGELNLTENQILYVYVGACPNYNTIWNGGGYSNYSGGDATDIRINGKTLSNRIIVAAGGGGTGLGPNSTYQYVGGAGGGLTGLNGTGPSYYIGYGGTQTSGGARGSQVENSWYNENGSFGKGGNSYSNSCGGAGRRPDGTEAVLVNVVVIMMPEAVVVHLI